MKRIKKFLRRNEKQNEVQETAEKPFAASSQTLKASSATDAATTQPQRKVPISSGISSNEATRAAARKTQVPKTPAPSPVLLKKKKHSPTSASSSEKPSAVPAYPKSPDNSATVPVSTSKDSKKSYKGVSESFKGLSGPQRYGIADGTAEKSGADVRRLGKLRDAYDSIPLIEKDSLPRGGISMETKAVGRVQFGIPPETIKDSMSMGIPVPQVYVVPAERFCRELGPALGVNLAEFEFPGYFNYFIYKKKCTLVVDSQEAEDNICRVFNETLLGPGQFRREVDPIPYAEEDFAPNFPRDDIPNLEKELRHFRIMPDGTELSVDEFFEFSHFNMPGDGYCHENLGVPPNLDEDDVEEDDDMDEQDLDEALSVVLGEEVADGEEAFLDAADTASIVNKPQKGRWSYKSARWIGDVATVWPSNTTEQQKLDRSVPRVEIFKMPSGTEYIIHDVDENNIIVGKARFSGHVKVSETIGVEGFGEEETEDQEKESVVGRDINKDVTNYQKSDSIQTIPKTPRSFYPPSFGLTTLGNSHGFDKKGSTSGYVLWVNGRGIMIDPPPYSSATLEREGIRPRTIVAIILTHCHADHDAGAFQKVLTGSPVVVITTPTIYKSFIRKYSALASLSPSLLRHSHRYKPAIIGEPLRFQGATFYFTYSLHVIPCVAFRVEWRGRSMVFTGDHMNIPSEIDRLQSLGVLSKGRADNLRNLPLQECDLLLHEAGAPPIHTPLEELMKLPERVKKRLYVVHSSSIPPDCDLRLAPTGTAGTLRLDRGTTTRTTRMERMDRGGLGRNRRDAPSTTSEEDEIVASTWSGASNEYAAIEENSADEVVGLDTSFRHTIPQNSKKGARRSSIMGVGGHSVPLVSLRAASSTDAWFILNLLSAVPFLSSLSYSSTMEVLETARVDAYCKNDVVLPISRRAHYLCVVWEGTCVERRSSARQRPDGELSSIDEAGAKDHLGAAWHAGDWTGPISLQPEKRLSGESDLAATHDIVAMSNEGVKVITIDFSSLHQILKSGSQLYSKHLEWRQRQQRRPSIGSGSNSSTTSTVTHKMLTEAMKGLNILELLDQNFALRKLSAVQKRHLESLAEGPIAFPPGERLWRAGAPVENAFMMVAGTASFVPKRRNAGSASVPNVHMGLTPSTRSMLSRLGESSKIGEDMKNDIIQAVEEMGESVDNSTMGDQSVPMVQLESLFSRAGKGESKSITEAHDFAKLSKTLQNRAEKMASDNPNSDGSIGSSHDDSLSADSDHFSAEEVGNGASGGHGRGASRRSSLSRRRSSRARFQNKVLGRLYSRRAFTGGLVFSRGHFLGDVSKMVAGILSLDYNEADADSTFPTYGFGDKAEGAREPVSENLTDMVIHEQEGDGQTVHSSTLTAGKDGCVVLVFPKENLIPFLDEYPGLLLSLLGTQVVV